MTIGWDGWRCERIEGAYDSSYSKHICEFRNPNVNHDTFEDPGGIRECPDDSPRLLVCGQPQTDLTSCIRVSF